MPEPAEVGSILAKVPYPEPLLRSRALVSIVSEENKKPDLIPVPFAVGSPGSALLLKVVEVDQLTLVFPPDK
jgi:hypothetical protein